MSMPVHLQHTEKQQFVHRYDGKAPRKVAPTTSTWDPIIIPDKPSPPPAPPSAAALEAASAPKDQAAPVGGKAAESASPEVAKAQAEAAAEDQRREAKAGSLIPEYDYDDDGWVEVEMGCNRLHLCAWSLPRAGCKRACLHGNVRASALTLKLQACPVALWCRTHCSLLRYDGKAPKKVAPTKSTWDPIIIPDKPSPPPAPPSAAALVDAAIHAAGGAGDVPSAVFEKAEAEAAAERKKREAMAGSKTPEDDYDDDGWVGHTHAAGCCPCMLFSTKVSATICSPQKTLGMVGRVTCDGCCRH